MGQKLYLFFICLILLPVTTYALSHSPMPAPSTENKSNHAPLLEKNSSIIDEFLFYRLIEKFKYFSLSQLAEQNKQLELRTLWDSSEVKAQATRDDLDNPVIIVHGGMARHPEMTPDGFLLVLCHELGHFLGGAPKKLRGNTNRKSWSSTEGQADYYATAKCLRRILSEEEGHEFFVFAPTLMPPEVQLFCRSQTCQRTLMAGLQVAKVFADVMVTSNPPQLNKRDKTIVPHTLNEHPSVQCRLDTFRAGALCPVSSEIGFDDEDPTVGACLTQTHSPEKGDFSRPACWFQPQQAD